MKATGRRLLRSVFAFFAGTMALGMLHTTAIAKNDTDRISAITAGAATVIDADDTDTDAKSESGNKAQKDKTDADDEDGESDRPKLVMANVKSSVNVREEANEESDKVGKLYEDCGGDYIERKDGWTKLKSGNVVGWVRDDFLLFGADARKKADEVGMQIATVTTNGLRVRKEPKEDAGIYGMIGKGEEVEALGLINDKWLSVEFEGDKGYISAEYATVEFVIDAGETMEEIKKREAAEEKEKRKKAELEAKRKADEAAAKSPVDLGAVPVESSDEVMLGALIQCEAGGQPYEGMLAVGAVVMNRIRSAGYPNTVQGVIYASGQFPPALNGKVAAKITKGVKASCLQAAQEAIAGASNVGTATHFRRAGNHDGIVIGSHVFW